MKGAALLAWIALTSCAAPPSQRPRTAETHSPITAEAQVGRTAGAEAKTADIVVKSGSPQDCKSCDCAHHPWSDSCKACCEALLLTRATKYQLIDLVKVSPIEYEAIKSARQEAKHAGPDGLVTFKTLQGRMSEDAIASVKSKIDNLSAEEVKMILMDLPPSDGSPKR